MPRYAILPAPSANRVYAAGAPAMVAAELTVLADGPLGGRIGAIGIDRIGDLDVIGFTAAELDTADLAALSNLSALYALFERVGGDAPESRDLLRPLVPTRLDRYDDDLISILKYPGKTNEQFTKLLLNVTVWSATGGATTADRRWTVLDPMCGRGTTLNQALMYGWNTVGIDLDTKDFDAYTSFLSTWLKDKRLRHTADTTRIRRDGAVLGRRFDAHVAATKEDLKAGNAQSVSYFNVDTLRSGEMVRAGSVDVIVTDAPYGVRHGSTTPGRGRDGGDGEQAASGRPGADRLRRSPTELLREAVPIWARLLRPGGAIGISWNTRVAPRPVALGILADAGLEPLDGPGYDGLCHRVDRTIVRDVVVARRPGARPDR